ncbi:nucleoside-diphosphate-sugar epimerase [Longilinea arvoryzae]|uniref:Nucleoside-diphosphate-sugar epimerase n=1 Tax=Longilinea arvoryzae TaxID=360412 RepID=A0A0S7BDF7_9CHLR|nr:NAD-dependent epimerase/dehydratase family protein [Longilinea arvoryzae]GAP13437.1 nucleoside-diphosphate-sugar epimerase [Longilinea arvoryzae]
MKILVTGGAGFIASHVVDLYIANGHEVVILDDLSTGRASNLNPAARFIKMDIRDPRVTDVFEQEHPDVVNHHAAQMDVRRSIVEPLFDADVNIIGSLNLLENARKNGVRHFIYISSGGAAYGEPKYLPCDEEHPVDPICQYGASKHTVEHYLYMYRANYGLEYTVLRYPNVFGPRQDPKGEAGVVAIFTGRMLSGQPVIINGDGEQERDFVFVGDCAQANLLAITHPHPSGVYNLGSASGTNVNRIFQVLKQITGFSQEAIHGPAKLGETRKIYLDASKAHKELGWQPKVDFMDGLRQTVAYFQKAEMPV